MTRTSIQIRWSDIDQLGHVYNGQYQHFFDIGKSDYFQQILGLSHDWATTGNGFLTAQTLNNYLAPIKMQEPIEVETEVESIGNKSFTMTQKIINTQTLQIKADSRSVIVCFNPLTQQTIPVSQEWRDKMLRPAAD